MFAGLNWSRTETLSTERLETLRADLFRDMREVRNEIELGTYRKALRQLDDEISARVSA